jgi:protein O-mannosyl-transferase
VTFLVQRKAGVMHTLGSVPFLDRVSNALVSYARYVGKLIWPEPLSVLYRYQYHWPAAILSLSILFVLAVTAGAVVWRRRYPYLFVGWCWFLGALVPVIGLVPIGGQAMSERYTYLPHLGLLVALVWGIDTWIKHRNLPHKLAAGVVAMALGLCLVQTHRQIAFWKDGETLFRHALQVDPQSAEACYCLGNALREKGHGEAAIVYYRQALELRKEYPEVWHDLGVTLMGLGRVDEALQALEEAVNCSPGGAASAEAALCSALGMAGRVEQAIQHGERAVVLNPRSSEARQNLAVVLARNKQFDRANENFREAIRLNPRYAVAHQNWGMALEDAGRMEEAIAEYRRAIALKPKSLQAREYLAACLFRANRFEEAAAEFEALSRLAPNHAPTHNNLGIVLLRLGRRELAAAQFREALRLRPDLAEARENLGRLRTR